MTLWTTKDVLRKIHVNADHWSGVEAAALNEWFHHTSLEEIKNLDLSVLKELTQLLGMPIEYPFFANPDDRVTKLDNLRLYVDEQMDNLLRQDDVRAMLMRLRDR